MANQEQLEILKSGVENWNRWRKDNPNLEIDLSQANLSNANLSNADFNSADLSEACLKGAKLQWANLRLASLSSSDLREANLKYADLSWSYLNNTSFNHAIFGGTTLCHVVLNKAFGLEFCIHNSESYIDYHTLRISEDIPPLFLRGCGLSDDYIEAIPSLFGKPPEFYFCFISYSTKDQEFAERLQSDLQNRGIRAWYAPEELKAGDYIIDQIDKGIKVTDKLLLILSQNSIGSNWVQEEIARAYKKSKQLGKRVLFPISLMPFEELKAWEYFDSDEGKDLAKEIRKFYVPNFENWKDHDEYKQNLDRLVDSLRIEKHNSNSG